MIDCRIRPETPADYAGVYEVNRLAFGQDAEPRLVEAMRQTPDHIPELSLVAESSGRIIGHVLFSPTVIEGGGAPVPTLSLAPLAVRPEFQRQGVGSALTRAGLEAARRLGHRLLVVVGHKEYYPRFGFVDTARSGIEPPIEIPPGVFMVCELVPGALAGVRGTLRFPAPYYAALEAGKRPEAK